MLFLLIYSNYALFTELRLAEIRLRIRYMDIYYIYYSIEKIKKQYFVSYLALFGDMNTIGVSLFKRISPDSCVSGDLFFRHRSTVISFFVPCGA